MEIQETVFYSKNLKEFNCIDCDFKCFNKHDYTRHLSTSKHKNKVNGNDLETLEIANYSNYSLPYICKCSKEFKTNSGLWKHKQKCTFISDEDIDPTKPISNEVILSVLQQNRELQQMLVEQNKTIIEMSKNSQINTNHINSHNKTFNLQFFLNETCKDAMNIMDFVDSLKIQMSDLENVGKLGYVNGISNLIIQNLKAMDVTKRPVHCSDHKREIMYVKDDNQWYNESKETEGNQKLKKAIKRIAHKNICMIPEWKALYPDCIYSDSKKSDIYNHIIYESMDNSDEHENKIIKKIAKEVVIEK
jgi:hypothetical protein